MAEGEGWSIQDSAALYGLDRWGDPYFTVNGRGHISVQPQGERGGSLDLVDLVTHAKQALRIGQTAVDATVIDIALFGQNRGDPERGAAQDNRLPLGQGETDRDRVANMQGLRLRIMKNRT